MEALQENVQNASTDGECPSLGEMLRARNETEEQKDKRQGELALQREMARNSKCFRERNLIHFKKISEEDREQIRQTMKAIEFEPYAGTRKYCYSTFNLTAWCPYALDTDWFRLELWYVPNKNLLENLSVQTYCENWRNVRITAEDLATEIERDLVAQVAPTAYKILIKEENSDRTFTVHYVEAASFNWSQYEKV